MTEHWSGHADDNFPFSWGSDSIFMHACLQSYGESICELKLFKKGKVLLKIKSLIHRRQL